MIRGLTPGGAICPTLFRVVMIGGLTTCGAFHSTFVRFFIIGRLAACCTFGSASFQIFLICLLLFVRYSIFVGRIIFLLYFRFFSPVKGIVSSQKKIKQRNGMNVREAHNSNTAFKNTRYSLTVTITKSLDQL